MPDGLDQHAGHDAFWRSLHELHGKATTDTVTHEKELLDSEMVHQPQLIVGECVPGVSGGDWAGGFAAIRVALIQATGSTCGVGLSDAWQNQATRAIGGREGCKVIALSPKSTRASG